MYLHFYDK
jgi:alpha-1,3-mannosylglycoprotein beta-1,4-N-acetylglucosaminyltransferase A/B